jgi:hypothetical protein
MGAQSWLSVPGFPLCPIPALCGTLSVRFNGHPIPRSSVDGGVFAQPVLFQGGRNEITVAVHSSCQWAAGNGTQGDAEHAAQEHESTSCAPCSAQYTFTCVFPGVDPSDSSSSSSTGSSSAAVPSAGGSGGGVASSSSSGATEGDASIADSTATNSSNDEQIGSDSESVSDLSFHNASPSTYGACWPGLLVAAGISALSVTMLRPWI